MKLARLSLVCTLLVLVASPLFALPCQSCTAPVYPYCEDSPESGTRCSIGVDWCVEVSRPNCSPFAPGGPPPAMLAEWTVASIEISRPGQDTKVVTSPAAVADLAPSAAQK
jgi:hypothetical protein